MVCKHHNQSTKDIDTFVLLYIYFDIFYIRNMVIFLVPQFFWLVYVQVISLLLKFKVFLMFCWSQEFSQQIFLLVDLSL